jgi:hypothetical protein
MTDTKPTNSDGDLARLALRLHIAIPAATDHPWRPLGNPAPLQRHLVRCHRLDLDGEHADLFREQFTSPEQLQRFADEPAEARAILAFLLDPFVEQLLDVLDQLPAELHPIVLTEAPLTLRLSDSHDVHATDAGSAAQAGAVGDPGRTCGSRLFGAGPPRRCPM